jgi:predicted enzyme related to lactoylglutathione lyase
MPGGLFSQEERDGSMPLVFHSVVIDAKNPIDLARFWAAALGFETVTEEEGWAQLADPSGKSARISFQYEREGKVSSNRLHLDLKAGDADAEAERLRRLGATVKREFREPEEIVIVMLDPEGNEFCVFCEGPGR